MKIYSLEMKKELPIQIFKSPFQHIELDSLKIQKSIKTARLVMFHILRQTKRHIY